MRGSGRGSGGATVALAHLGQGLEDSIASSLLHRTRHRERHGDGEADKVGDEDADKAADKARDEDSGGTRPVKVRRAARRSDNAGISFTP